VIHFDINLNIEKHFLNNHHHHSLSSSVLITKLLGLNIVVEAPKVQGINMCMNNKHKLTIKEEIAFIEQHLACVEKMNLANMNTIKHKAEEVFAHQQQQQQHHSHMKSNESDINDLNATNIKQIRFDNLINLIYEMQMKQFAESICGIKKDIITNNYYVYFDPSEKISMLNLSQHEYEELINYRDPLNSISVYDLFQEKTYSYFTGIKGKNAHHKSKSNHNNTNTHNHSNTNHNTHKLRKSSSSSSLSAHSHYDGPFQVGKKIQIEYDYCHHCKQRKPGEIMIQCKAHTFGDKQCHRPIKLFHVNGTSIIRKNRNLIIKNYTGDTQEYVDLTQRDEKKSTCKRFFCHFCLRGSYDTLIDNIKDKKDWICPYCQGICFCSRCTRHDKMLKLIGLYLSLGGDVNILYDCLITRNKILDLLHNYLVLAKLIIVVNDKRRNISELIKKTKMSVCKGNEDKIETLIEEGECYKEMLEEIKMFFVKAFEQGIVDKEILDNVCKGEGDININEDNDNNNDNSCLNDKDVFDSVNNVINNMYNVGFVNKRTYNKSNNNNKKRNYYRNKKSNSNNNNNIRKRNVHTQIYKLCQEAELYLQKSKEREIKRNKLALSKKKFLLRKRKPTSTKHNNK
jgi:hypothetical protein